MNEGFLAHFWVDLHDSRGVLFSSSIRFEIYRCTISKSSIFSGRRMTKICEDIWISPVSRYQYRTLVAVKIADIVPAGSRYCTGIGTGER
jgi:hypothetical protein